MEVPFIFGKVVDRTAFINRQKEILRFQNNFLSLTNTVLISPRRWGKSSLVKRSTQIFEKKHKNYRTCFIDLYKVRSEPSFYQLYAESIINATSSRLEDTLKMVRSLFKTIIPRISISPDPGSEISLSMDWQSISKNPSEILELAEAIAKRKKIKIVVCLDEFQNVGAFENPTAFQKTIRACWQHHKHVTYCLYGSKRHMMMELFSSPSMPLYKFGDLIFLNKIETNHWIKYLQRQFSRSNKSLHSDLAHEIVSLVENHSYYVQQLAQVVWLRTASECTSKIVEDAVESLQLQLSLLFQQITSGLSKKQVNFLHALTNGEDSLSAKETINKYNLGTSGTVNKVKLALQDKEIIDLMEPEIEFVDPIYKLWLKNHYFK